MTRSLSKGTSASGKPTKSTSKAKQAVRSSSTKKAVGRPKKRQSQVNETSALPDEQSLVDNDETLQAGFSVAVALASDKKAKAKAKAKTKTKDNAAEQSEDEIDADSRQYWLMKAEPGSRIEKGKDVKFSIDDLQAATSPEPWDGVRNLEGEAMNESRICNRRYQLTGTARNHMRAMTKGDLAFFYHSNCKVPGIVGIMEIVQEHTVDGKAPSQILSW